ncbi:LacI family DNA-binding transcriptional regulator [Ructibacterium gallinarum]|uniref:LacI family DNA-binding transcriptional regulator n=1 Tax=Ructibacterium gallinarum TaxID=2779355 RepID=A0A9D5R9P1_9FIRM|nr:LacI family DNA-binding transcriptional regulator [Ructibacterium gallinarum]MBE5040704.1 LacI family DNA-binding transcriptional regulator [Ructibacterium gallinarum]
MKKATIKDVAALAGVSVSAVSYVLNQSTEKKYSEKTRQKIYSAAEKLGYHPNHIARGMRSQRSYSIGIVNWWEINNRVFIKTLEGITAMGEKLGYSVVICPSADSYSYLSYYENKRIDGAVLIAPVTSMAEFNEMEHIRRLQKAKIPFAVINGHTDLPQGNCFRYDFAQTTYLATDYLLAKGHREIIYIAPKYGEEIREVGLRQKGYMTRMQEEGLPCLCRAVEDLTPQMLKQFHSIVTNKTDTAKKVMDMALTAGIKIPEDLSIIAANTEYYSEYLPVPLTTVQIPFQSIGKMAMRRVISAIEHHDLSSEEMPACMVLEQNSVKNLSSEGNKEGKGMRIYS